MDYPAHIFAYDMYCYLLPKRIPGVENLLSHPRWHYRRFLENNESEFSPEVGKVVLLRCRIYRDSWWREFENALPSLESEAFFIAATKTITTFYDKGRTDVFQNVLQISAAVLELAVFCHAYGLARNVEFTDSVWVGLFVYYFREPFYEGGGFGTLREIAQREALLFDKLDVLGHINGQPILQNGRLDEMHNRTEEDLAREREYSV